VTRRYSQLFLSAFSESQITNMRKLAQAAVDETDGLHWRLLLAQSIMATLPPYVGNRLRVSLLGLAGFDIGKGTVIWGRIMITGSGNLYDRLHIGESCWFNDACQLDLNAPIHIGNRVSLGHQVLLMTSTHAIGNSIRRAGEFVTCPIHIGDGAWLGSRCTILPGITVGEGAVVAAGAIVTNDVRPNTLVAGVPAKIIRCLP
jgi:maltose O-acetyltransferase